MAGRTRAWILGLCGAACLVPVAGCRDGTGADTTRPPTRVSDVRRVTAGGSWQAPRFSPDGSRLLVSGARFRGLYTVELGGSGIPKVLAEDDGLGFAAEWTAEGVAARSRDEREVLFRDPAGSAERSETGRAIDTPRPGARVHAYSRDDAIHLVADGRDRVIASGDDKFYRVTVSPDGSALAIEGLATGIRIHDVATGRSTPVGRGNHPAWLPGSTGIVYDMTEDDGAEVTAGDLWVFDRTSGRATRLTATPDLVETWPAVSADGARIGFEAGGAVYVGTLL